MNNKQLSLDGVWSFLHVPQDSITPAEVREISVPGVWQAQFPDLRMRAGIGIYQRRFTLDRGWRRDCVFLRFGAVFHFARVWINGQHVGDHEGGFLPFSFDVTSLLQDDENEIVVRVESPTDDPNEFADAPFAEIPFGKQSWYGPLSGIWQSVRLEQRIADHVAQQLIQSDPDTGLVTARIALAAPLKAASSLEMRILGPGGAVAGTAHVDAAAGASVILAQAVVDDALKWSPAQPNLYRVQLTLRRDGEVIDEAGETIGFRKFETRDGQFYLNDEPLYLRGALDQDYYADTICTPPSMEFLEDQFRKARELGLNCLRCHIKAPDPRYYEAADRVGLLIWAELPNGGFSTERSRARKERMLKGIVDRDGHHPSIVCWTIINENWGVDLVHDAEHRAWLRKLYAWLKSYDPSRPVVDNSPVAPSFHIETDIADYHFYAAYPDSRADWDRFVDGLAGRADWLFSPEGDAVITGREPLVCSEFGNWGLPDPTQLAGVDGQEPWWFETGHDWGEGVMYAHGIENRFRDWSLDRVFGSLRAFVEAAQWQQYHSLKYEIERMRRRPEIAGYVITEFTDCHWESNGLLDMLRNPRVFHAVFARINADTVIVPDWQRLSYWDDEQATIGVSIANGAEAIEGATLAWSVDGQESVSACRAARGTVTELEPLVLKLPPVETARSIRIGFELRAADQRLIASNSLDLAVHPASLRHAAHDKTVWAPSEELRQRLRAQGYRLVGAMAEAELIIATAYDEAIAAHVRAGGTLLLLADHEMSLNPFFPHWQNVRVQSRAGALWRGDWVSTFAWLRRRGAFAHVPGGPLIDATFDRVIPELVISGCNLLDFQARVHAALVIGWIHKPVALAVERGYGKGRVLVSTFRLFRDDPLADPTATVLLDALVTTALRAQTLPATAAEQLSGGPDRETLLGSGSGDTIRHMPVPFAMTPR
ncbi:glycoside hydrolase family 2 protein [Bradyrhizobium sp. USDA 4353]